MALNGTLADLGIVDLIQFPNKGRRSGELILAGATEEARLYYQEGNLTHAVVGNFHGMDALVEVVSWTEGEFEFRTGVESEIRSMEIDLHRALMVALKIRDERMEELRKNRSRTEPPRSEGDKAIRAAHGILKKNPCVQGICIFGEDGKVVVELESEDVAEKGRFAQVRESIAALYKQYGVGGLARTFFEDELSVVHGARLANQSIAIIAANRETSMGQLSLMMNRLISAVEEAGA